MRVKNKKFSTIWIENSEVKIIDQTKLPHQFTIKDLKTVDDAIKWFMKQIPKKTRTIKMEKNLMFVIALECKKFDFSMNYTKVALFLKIFPKSDVSYYTS